MDVRAEAAPTLTSSLPAHNGMQDSPSSAGGIRQSIAPLSNGEQHGSPQSIGGKRPIGHRVSRQQGFTLIELILVLVIVALGFGVFTVRFGILDTWREKNALQKLTETIVLLNNQAVMDQAFYRMEFDLEENSWRVGVMRPEDMVAEADNQINLPPLVLELATLLSPSMPDGTTMIPPPSMPSLATPLKLPGQMVFLDIVTPRGKIARDEKRENPYLLFSPRGFSEFGVIHISMGESKAVTVLVNPWTGLAEVFREYKEFKWTLGR